LVEPIVYLVCLQSKIASKVFGKYFSGLALWLLWSESAEHWMMNLAETEVDSSSSQ
jgi:hypothetical protein